MDNRDGHSGRRGAWSACLAVLLAACASAPPRDAATRAADERIAAAVVRALDQDPRIFARHIDVDVQRQVVTLSGFVFESADLFEATRVASQVPGVTAVNDDIELNVGGRGAVR
ncbi:MAG: BON domain-containing protein [Pseudomonadota bacterium]|nr:BON domain-containing protein [Pseudomonadota bacterium]